MKIETIEECIKLYSEGVSSTQLSKQFGYSSATILYHVKKAGIIPRSNKVNSRRYDLNHNYFDKIDTEDKAYWLGFLAADGFITSDRPQIGITLSRKDKEHLALYNKCLDSTYLIKDYVSDTAYKKATKSSKVLVTSEQMYAALVKLGFTPNKTYEFKLPELEAEMYPHFIRGYFDGDGSWSKDKESKAVSYKFRLMGTQSFLEDVKKLIGIDNQVSKAKGTFEVTKTGAAIIPIAKYLYKDAKIYLPRKYERAKFLMSL